MTKITKSSSNRKRSFASIYRINISYLSSKKFGTFQALGKNTKRAPDVSPSLDALKVSVLDHIWHHQRHRGLVNYTIAWQIHQSNGLAHLDILLRYERNIKKSACSFDYILPLCPQDLDCFSQTQGQRAQLYITPYSATRLNLAILEYGQKEDPQPLSNFGQTDSERYLTLAAIKNDPYTYLETQMRKDPYNFDFGYYATRYDLAKHIRGWSSIKAKLTDVQTALRALAQQAKPGIRTITRQLIEERLTATQLLVFDTHPCFQTIVDHLNQIPRYGSDRPHKTLNLFIYGPRGIGKTSFVNQGPVNLASLVPHYDINLQNKYLNRYYNNVYGFISWNQFKYTDFSPTWVLKLLQGLDLQIPLRYASNIKRDNPLIIATSNMSLSYHIQRRFRDQPALIEMAKSNLLNQRITQVYVPVPMFFMQKLLLRPS